MLGDDQYQISIAVAGFGRDDITIEAQDNALTVTGKKPAPEDAETERKFLHKGISERNFERKFQLGDHVKVTGAAMNDGLLHITLERIIPEAKKPRKIEIGSRTYDNQSEQ